MSRFKNNSKRADEAESPDNELSGDKIEESDNSDDCDNYEQDNEENDRNQREGSQKLCEKEYGRGWLYFAHVKSDEHLRQICQQNFLARIHVGARKQVYFKCKRLTSSHRQKYQPPYCPMRALFVPAKKSLYVKGGHDHSIEEEVLKWKYNTSCTTQNRDNSAVLDKSDLFCSDILWSYFAHVENHGHLMEICQQNCLQKTSGRYIRKCSTKTTSGMNCCIHFIRCKNPSSPISDIGQKNACPIEGIYVRAKRALYLRNCHNHSLELEEVANKNIVGNDQLEMRDAAPKLGEPYVDGNGKVWHYLTQFRKNVPMAILKDVCRRKYKLEGRLDYSKMRLQCVFNGNYHGSKKSYNLCQYRGIFLIENSCLYVRNEHNHGENVDKNVENEENAEELEKSFPIDNVKEDSDEEEEVETVGEAEQSNYDDDEEESALEVDDDVKEECEQEEKEKLNDEEEEEEELIDEKEDGEENGRVDQREGSRKLCEKEYGRGWLYFAHVKSDEHLKQISQQNYLAKRYIGSQKQVNFTCYRWTTAYRQKHPPSYCPMRALYVPAKKSLYVKGGHDHSIEEEVLKYKTKTACAASSTKIDKSALVCSEGRGPNSRHSRWPYFAYVENHSKLLKICQQNCLTESIKTIRKCTTETSSGQKHITLIRCKRSYSTNKDDQNHCPIQGIYISKNQALYLKNGHNHPLGAEDTADEKIIGNKYVDKMGQQWSQLSLVRDKQHLAELCKQQWLNLLNIRQANNYYRCKHYSLIGQSPNEQRKYCPFRAIFYKPNSVMYKMGAHDHSLQKNKNAPPKVGDPYMYGKGKIWRYLTQFRGNLSISAVQDLCRRKYKLCKGRWEKNKTQMQFQCVLNEKYHWDRRLSRDRKLVSLCHYRGIFLTENRCLYVRNEHNHEKNAVKIELKKPNADHVDQLGRAYSFLANIKNEKHLKQICHNNWLTKFTGGTSLNGNMHFKCSTSRRLNRVINHRERTTRSYCQIRAIFVSSKYALYVSKEGHNHPLEGIDNEKEEEEKESGEEEEVAEDDDVESREEKSESIDDVDEEESHNEGSNEEEECQSDVDTDEEHQSEVDSDCEKNDEDEERGEPDDEELDERQWGLFDDDGVKEEDGEEPGEDEHELPWYDMDDVEKEGLNIDEEIRDELEKVEEQEEVTEAQDPRNEEENGPNNEEEGEKEEEKPNKVLQPMEVDEDLDDVQIVGGITRDYKWLPGMKREGEVHRTDWPIVAIEDSNDYGHGQVIGKNKQHKNTRKVKKEVPIVAGAHQNQMQPTTSAAARAAPLVNHGNQQYWWQQQRPLEPPKRLLRERKGRINYAD